MPSSAEKKKKKINEDVGFKYTGIGDAIGIINGIKLGEDFSEKNMLNSHLDSEMESVIYSRYISRNAFPLNISYNHIEDFIKSVVRLEKSFNLIRINELDEHNVDIYHQLHEELSIPMISKSLDDTPAAILAYILKIASKNNIDIKDTTIGFIGLNSSVIKLTSLLYNVGFSKILGIDVNDNIVMDFENQNGLGTTNENILSNTDVLIFIKKQYEINELDYLRPGQFLIMCCDDNEISEDMISNKGIREFVSFNRYNLTSLTPGLIELLQKQDKISFSEDDLIKISEYIAEFVMLDNYQLPDVFSNIHTALKDIEL